jgi:hypothetical protein
LSKEQTPKIPDWGTFKKPKLRINTFFFRTL